LKAEDNKIKKNDRNIIITDQQHSDAYHEIEKPQSDLDELNLQKSIARKQRESAKCRNQLLISRQAAERDVVISKFEPNYYTNDYPELRRAEVIA
jgi:hypothetical protein